MSGIMSGPRKNEGGGAHKFDGSAWGGKIKEQISVKNLVLVKNHIFEGCVFCGMIHRIIIPTNECGSD